LREHVDLVPDEDGDGFTARELYLAFLPFTSVTDSAITSHRRRVGQEQFWARPVRGSRTPVVTFP
jgi:hypothetical protein